MQETSSRPSGIIDSEWVPLSPQFEEGLGHRASIGLLALATDRVGAFDTQEFLAVEGVALFTTRLPMSPIATPQSLAEMGPHLTSAARLLVPGSRLDVIGFSCTSGTIAIGSEKVREALHAARPGIAVTTPIDAGCEALHRLGVRRISLAVPYLIPTAKLVSGYFEQKGIEIVQKATFHLGGDPDMNRLSPQALIDAAVAVDTRASEAVFISCTGLRTAPIIAEIEQRLRKPVVTSNQALAWHALRLSGIEDRIAGRGTLFRHL
jgi:maleate isomerase